MTLYDRCKAFIGQQQQRAIMRTGEPVQELMEFVLAEKGRAADKGLEDTLPLVLYFGSEGERAEFEQAISEWKSTAITRRMP